MNLPPAKKKYIVRVEYINDSYVQSGCYIPLPEELLEELGWNLGTPVVINRSADNKLVITKPPGKDI